MRPKKKASIAAKTGLALLSLCALALAIVMTAGWTAPAQYGLRTEGGQPEYLSRYMRMPDGVPIAVDVWLPHAYRGGKLPVMVHLTRYWRAQEPSILSKGLVRLHLMKPDAGIYHDGWSRKFLDAGYAVVGVDSRGTGASGGVWRGLFSPEEIGDLKSVFDWIVAQPWSNGRIGTWGLSYPGHTAELAAAIHHPALKVVVPAFVYWDVMRQLESPGGVFNQWFTTRWSSLTEALDHNDVCDGAGFQCKLTQAVFYDGVKRAESDLDSKMLAGIIANRRVTRLSEQVGGYNFRGDRVGVLPSPDEIMPKARRDAIASSNVALYVMSGYYDAAGAESAVDRFVHTPNPQQVVIGPWSHGAKFNTDPFLPENAAVVPAQSAQIARVIAFLDRYLKNGDAAPDLTRSISYYLNGAGNWRTTGHWPPDGLADRKLFLATGRQLSDQPGATGGRDDYRVDFTATTGIRNRWHTVFGGPDVVYPDRAEEDRKLLSYTSAPLPEATELVGTPVVTLQLVSDQPDGAVFVYLEDVAPDGRVTYLTEGQLRLIHRKTEPNDLPDTVLGPRRSYAREDAQPVVPGQAMTAEIGLHLVSAVIMKGHRLRISIGGHDAASFRRYPAKGIPTFGVVFGAANQSFLVVPIKPYSPRGTTATVPPVQ